MTWIIIVWIAGVIATAALISWRDPWEDNRPGMIALCWLWPFVWIQVLGFGLGKLIHKLTNGRKS